MELDSKCSHTIAEYDDFITVNHLLLVFFTGNWSCLWCWGKKKMAKQHIIRIRDAIYFFSYVITTFVLSSIFGYNIEETLIEFKVMAESIEQLMGVAFPLGIEKTVLIIAGITFVVMVVMQSICVHLLAILVLRRMKIETNRFKTIFDLHLPKLLSFTTLLTLFAYGNVTRLQLSETAIAILTVLYVSLFMLYAGYGTSVAMCYLHKKGKRKYVFFLMLGLVFPPFWILMMALGIADSFMNLKKRM